MKAGNLLLGAGFVALLGAAAAHADTVTLPPSKDNTLYSDMTGALSNGAGEGIFAGLNSGAQIRRALLAFDLHVIHSGATILSATLTLHMSRTINGPQPVELHRVQKDWGEGTSVPNPLYPGGGAGGAATPGDATWIHTFYDTSLWTNPGGDFDAAVSAAAAVDTVGFYSWSSPGLVADVQAWVDNASVNFGWMVIGNEAPLAGTAKRFDSREHPDSTLRPRLRIEFRRDPTAAPEPPAAALRLEPNFPNPFNPSTTIAWALPDAGPVRLTVHDVRGRLVATLLEATQPAGERSLSWNGRGARGQALPSGLYFVRLVFGSETRMRPIVLAK